MKNNICNLQEKTGSFIIFNFIHFTESNSKS